MLVLAETIDQSLSFYDTGSIVKSTCFIHVPIYEMGSSFFAANWGNLASVAGLIFSFLSAWFARRASQAANSAREAVYRRNLAEDMNEAHGVASELLSLVDSRRYDVALPTSAKLQDLTVFIEKRWDGRLTEQTKKQCLTARAQLDSIQKVLSRLANEPNLASAKALVRLQSSCRLVKLIFVEEQAIAIRSSEGGHNER